MAEVKHPYVNLMCQENVRKRLQNNVAIEKTLF